MSDIQTCCRCGKPCNHSGNDESLDIWAMITTYTENGDVGKTGEQVNSQLLDADYLVVCATCAGDVLNLWNTFVKHVKKES